MICTEPKQRYIILFISQQQITALNFTIDFYIASKTKTCLRVFRSSHMRHRFVLSGKFFSHFLTLSYLSY